MRGNPARAFGSGRKLDLLHPDPWSWTGEDLATGLARTYRWGGHSCWDWPLSVAQHSLLVLAIFEQISDGQPTPARQLRELVHDAGELAGLDPFASLKAHLGPAFAAVMARLGAAVAVRYRLPAWTPAEHALHKRADRLAAASEAHHAAGWRDLADMRGILDIGLEPLLIDPLLSATGRNCRPARAHGSHGRPGLRPGCSWPGCANSTARRRPERWRTWPRQKSAGRPWPSLAPPFPGCPRARGCGAPARPRATA